MRKTFKKTFAALVAMTSLAVGVGSFSASASDVEPCYSGPMGYVYFGDSARAGIYVDPTTISISTDWSNGSTVYVKLVSTSGSAANGTKDRYEYDGSVTLSFLDSSRGFRGATSYHAAGGASKELVRTCSAD